MGNHRRHATRNTFSNTTSERSIGNDIDTRIQFDSLSVAQKLCVQRFIALQSDYDRFNYAPTRTTFTYYIFGASNFDKILAPTTKLFILFSRRLWTTHDARRNRIIIGWTKVTKTQFSLRLGQSRKLTILDLNLKLLIPPSIVSQNRTTHNGVLQ